MILFLLVVYFSTNLLMTLRLRRQLWGRGGFGGTSALLAGVLVGALLTLVVTGTRAIGRSELALDILGGLLIFGLWYVLAVIVFGIGS